MQSFSPTLPLDVRAEARALWTLTRLECRSLLRLPRLRQGLIAVAIALGLCSVLDGAYAQGLLMIGCTVGATLALLQAGRRGRHDSAWATGWSGGGGPIPTVLSPWLAGLAPYGALLLAGSLVAALVDGPLRGFGRVGVFDMVPRLLQVAGCATPAYVAAFITRDGRPGQGVAATVVAIGLWLTLGIQPGVVTDVLVTLVCLAGTVGWEMLRHAGPRRAPLGGASGNDARPHSDAETTALPRLSHSAAASFGPFQRFSWILRPLRLVPASFLSGLALVVWFGRQAMAGELDGTAGSRLAELGPGWIALFAGAFALESDRRAGYLQAHPHLARRMLAPGLLATGMAAFGLVQTIGLLLMVNGIPLEQTAFFMGLPDTLFLFLLAAAGTVWFGSPWVGVLLGAALWVPAMFMTAEVNPWLRLGSFTTVAWTPTHTAQWLVAKGELLALAGGLWALLPRFVQSAADRSDRMPFPFPRPSFVTGAALAAAVAVTYVLCGATTTVLAAAARRGDTADGGLTALRTGLNRYSAVAPVGLFGPVLPLLAQTGGSRTTFPNEGDLRNALDRTARRWPRDPWADSAAFELLHKSGDSQQRWLGRGRTMPARPGQRPPSPLDDTFAFATRFSRSPLAPLALAMVIQKGRGGYEDELVREATRLLVEKHPRSSRLPEAMEQLYQGPMYSHYSGQERPTGEEVIAGALLAAQYARTPEQRAIWLARTGELLWQKGELTDAVSAARAARKALDEALARRPKPSGRRRSGEPQIAALEKAWSAADEIIRSADQSE